ncbi:MAG: cyclase family protein [Proteobacteria bacterium]|nr:cyclase family protein [Pseudomonadota bacterium]
MKHGEILDISPPLGPLTAVWPGDTPLTRQVLLSIGEGANIDLSTLHTTVHVGAHADAPRHFNRSGPTIDKVPLEAYIGPCRVVTVTSNRLIGIKDCKEAVSRGATRILFRTDSFPNPNFFNQDFTAISPEAMEFLGQNGVRLVGIDTPSVDPFESKDLPAHQMLYKYKIANIEGLVLSHVDAGEYEFIGLPLKLVGFDASPIRAVIRLI